jgi:hypothetical protein
MWIAKLAIFLAVGCAALLTVLAYLLQTWMVFPTYLVGGASDELPAGASLFAIPTPDGKKLAAVRLPAADRGGGSRPVLLALRRQLRTTSSKWRGTLRQNEEGTLCACSLP